MNQPNIEQGGDDLGTIWYTFTNMTLEQVMQYFKKDGPDQYEITSIRINKHFWGLGGIKNIFVTLDKVYAIPQHKSEFYDLLKWVKNHGRGHKLEFTTIDNHNVLVTLFDKEAGKQYAITVQLDGFREYYSRQGDSAYFLDDLWNYLHPRSMKARG